MKVLALDVINKDPSIALYIDGRIFERSIAQMQIASSLISCTESLLDEAKINYNQINLAAVVKGPGGFTSTRSAVTFAKILASILDIKVFGCTISDVEDFLQRSHTIHKSGGINLVNFIRSIPENEIDKYSDSVEPIYIAEPKIGLHKS